MRKVVLHFGGYVAHPYSQETEPKEGKKYIIKLISQSELSKSELLQFTVKILIVLVAPQPGLHPVTTTTKFPASNNRLCLP